eukprot:3905543-Alexandrium_andersonii.AAC.1
MTSGHEFAGASAAPVHRAATGWTGCPLGAEDRGCQASVQLVLVGLQAQHLGAAGAQCTGRACQGASC